MKKLVIYITILLIVLFISNEILAQSKTVYLPSFETLSKGKVIKEGLSLINITESGYLVYSNKIKSKEIEYLIKKSDGIIVPSINQSTVEKGKRKCWHCVTDSRGDVDCFSQICLKSIESAPHSTQ